MYMCIKVINEGNVSTYVSTHIPMFKTHTCVYMYIHAFLMFDFLSFCFFFWISITVLSRLYQPGVKVGK